MGQASTAAQQRAVFWLDRTGVMTRDTLLQIAFSATNATAVRMQREHLDAWVRSGVMMEIANRQEEKPPLVALGPHAVPLLRAAGGTPVGFVTRTIFTWQLAIHGIAVTIACAARRELGVRAIDWTACDPASGSAGTLRIIYHPTDRTPPPATVLERACDAWPAEPGTVCAVYRVAATTGSQPRPVLKRLCGQIATLLADDDANRVPGTIVRPLWITDSSERAADLWAIWLRVAARPLLVGALTTLTVDGRFDPWHATWHDEHGRARTLTPYTPMEAEVRLHPSPPPRVTTHLADAILAARHGG